MKKREYKKGEYPLKNPKKYIGKCKPYYKSSYEQRMMYWLDENTKVLEWSYEPHYIEYLSHTPSNYPEWANALTDNSIHKYFVDFYAKLLDSSGNVVTYILEIKPYIQTIKPIEPKNKNKKNVKRFVEETKEYIKNMNKWEAAENYASQKGIKFTVLTERDLF